MSINQRQPKFNLSAHICVKESQRLKFNCFFPPSPLALTGPQNLGENSPQENAAAGQTEASSGPYLVQHEAEDTALSPTKQVSDLVLTGQKNIFSRLL